MGFHAAVCAILLAGGRHLPDLGLLLAWHVGLPTAWLGLAFGTRDWPPLRALAARAVLGAATITTTFSSLGLAVGRIGRPDAALPANYRLELAAADRWLCGGLDPQAAWEPFLHPLLIDALQACYLSYYLLPLLPIACAFARGRIDWARRLTLGALLALFTSYLGYFLVPATAPYSIAALMDALPSGRRPPGLLLGTFCYDFLDAAEKIPFDCFPSGHTEVTLVALAFAWRDQPRVLRILLPIGTGLICATIALRLHYWIDVLAGAALAAGVVWVAARWERAWRRQGSGTVSA